MTADEALRPGLKGEALPSGEIVLRLAHAPKDFAQTGKASAVSFDLSSKDKEAVLPSLSVFAERLTTPEQAMTLLDQPEAYDLVLRLNVDAVRALRPVPDTPEVPSLDVWWDPLTLMDAGGVVVPDDRPGAAGHAGIVGLSRPNNVPRLYYKSLRAQLAQIAEAVELPR